MSHVVPHTDSSARKMLTLVHSGGLWASILLRLDGLRLLPQGSCNRAKTVCGKGLEWV